MRKLYRYISFDLLNKLNKKAVKNKKNRSLTDELIKSLDKTKVFPITMSLLHNDVEMRCEILFNQNGKTGFLDLDLKDYQSLPKAMA